MNSDQTLESSHNASHIQNDISNIPETYVCSSCQHTTTTPGILYPAIYDNIIVRLNNEPMLLCAKAYNQWLLEVSQSPNEPQYQKHLLSDDNICLQQGDNNVWILKDKDISCCWLGRRLRHCSQYSNIEASRRHTWRSIRWMYDHWNRSTYTRNDLPNQRRNRQRTNITTQQW